MNLKKLQLHLIAGSLLLIATAPLTESSTNHVCDPLGLVREDVTGLGNDLANRTLKEIEARVEEINSACDGEIAIACAPVAFVCAQASAHAEYEEVNNMPNLYSHMTSGAGFTSQGFSGAAWWETTLGSGNCEFEPYSGCGETYSDVADVCKGMIARAQAQVSLILSPAAVATDFRC